MQITVVGRHEWSLAPERATVHVLVDFEGDDRAATSRVATETVDALGAELHRLRTTGDAPLTWHSVGPLATRSWRPYNDRGEILPPRYGASVNLQARFRNFTALAEVTAGWAERDGVQITHVQWALTDDTRRQVEADSLTRAVEEARTRALAIAQASGWESVEVVEVSDPGLLSAPPGGPVAVSGMAFERMAFKADQGGGGGLAPEDVRGEAMIHARFTALR